MDNNDVRARGNKTYKEYFGEEKKSFEDPLDDFTIDHLFANIWSRKETLSMENRSRITIALLAAQGRDEELKKHMAGAKNLGIPNEEIIEIILHVAHYAGWPAGHHGMTVYHDFEKEPNN